MRRSRTLVTAATALVVAGAGLAGATAVPWGSGELRAERPEQPVNERAGDLRNIDAHNSPALARSPRDPAMLAVGSRIDTPDNSCALHVSHDAGATWRATRVPVPPGEGPKCYAPDVAFAADGRLHVVFVTLRGIGNVPHAVWATSSGDGGSTLAAPRRIAGPRAFQVRLAADPDDARTLHVTWLQAGELGPLRFSAPGAPIVAARSDDGGRSWGRAVPVSAPARLRVLAPTPAVGRGGALHVLFVDVGDDRLDYHGGHDGFGGPPYPGRFALVLARARDRGAGWQESVVADDVVPIERFVPFLPAFPALGIDRRDGRVLAGYHDGRAGSADVVVWALDPGAARWRGPVRVHDAPRGDRSTQRLPQLAVAPGGRVDVVYYDRRADPRDVRSEVALQSSGDGGRTFGARQVLTTRAFDARIGFGSERGMPDLGSRLGLVSGDDGALAVWADTRWGTDASNKQDLYLARLREVRSLDGPRVTARHVGLALAAGGVAGLALAARRRRRSR